MTMMKTTTGIAITGGNSSPNQDSEEQLMTQTLDILHQRVGELVMALDKERAINMRLLIALDNIADELDRDTNTWRIARAAIDAA